ncbi:MAG: hypothetical protein ACK53Y_11640, partial [bacterium]
VGVFCPRQALQPDMRYLAPVVTDLCLYLSYALLQRHGGLHLQEADFRLQAGDLCLPRRRAKLARRDLHPCHRVKEDHDVLDVGAHGGSATEQEGLRQLQASYLVLLAALHDDEPAHIGTAGIG